jgi:hypothetical protein
MGGLGNQMFQYALGRRLAYDRNVPLKLDLSWFRDAVAMGVNTVRGYALDGWRIQASIANPDDLAGFPLRDGLLARLRLTRSPVIKERGFGFDARVLRAPPHAHLTGYWQSERYFKVIRDILLRDFTPVAAACTHAARLVDQARAPGAAALHVRRGDYITNVRTREFHGICPIEYYQEAARRIAACAAEPCFLVFSDDPDWASQNLKLGWPTTYVTHDGGCSAHQDMWLMSQCSHHVIANSSFSWWGAWLCQNDDKRVFAPDPWFRDTTVNTDDLIPEGWTKLRMDLLPVR